MAWRQKLRNASFRGVPFKVAVSDSGFGRIIKEIPRWQTQPITQDKGPELDEFVIEGYIIQNADNAYDYFENRNKLIQAFKGFDKKNLGAGTLVHPFYGNVKVHVSGRARFVESFGEGGITRFSVTFLSDGPSIFPGTTKDFTSEVDNAVLAAIDKFSDNYLNRFITTATNIQAAGAAAIKTMQKVQTAVNSVRGAIASTITAAIGVINAATSIVGSLLNSPCEMFDTIKSAGDALGAIAGLGDAVVSGGVIGGCSGTVSGELVELDGITVPETLGTSLIETAVGSTDYTDEDLGTTTTSQVTNVNAVTDANKITTLGNAMRIAIRTDFSSQENLTNSANLIAGAIDDLLLSMGAQVDIDNTDAFVALEDMRNVFIANITAKGTGLTKTIQYKVPNGVQSTLELAYNLYFDLDRSTDIKDRNRPEIRHPGFMPSGDNINVLEE